MTNRPSGVLYTGVTSSLAHRVHQHRSGTGSAFATKYKLTRLVYAERHEDISAAIWREKAIKAWQPEWKVRLIEKMNPAWRDMYDDLVNL